MEMDMLTFRDEPRFSDIEDIARILGESGFFNQEEQEVGVSLVRERLDKGVDSGYYFQFGEIDREVVAYTCFGPIPGTKSSYDLYWIAVDNKRRGCGLGSLLLVQTEVLIREMGGTRVYIETSSSPLYEPTRSFYVRNGYILEATLQDYYAPQDHKLMYVKVI
jgi:ribosomal protein S18 acetylase RimI-like enzyme